MIKAILLDFYGTLAYDTIDFNATWSDYYQFLFSHFKTPRTYQIYLDALQKTIDWAKYMREIKLQEVTFYQFHSRVLAHLNIPISQKTLKSLFSIYLRHKIVHFYDGVDDVLEVLKQKGYKLVLISNANSLLPLMKLRERKLDRYFDKICISSELGIRKPHPYIFICALNALHIASDEAIMVGDHSKLDIFGAKRLGIKAILIRKKKKSKIYSENYHPDVVIDSILQLPTVLEKMKSKF